MMIANQASAEAAVVENIKHGNTIVRQEVVEAKTEIINALKLLDWREWNSRDDRSWENVKLNSMTSEQKKSAFKSYACQYLSYRSMSERYSDVPDAHRSTFHWIYKPPAPGVGTWKDFSQ
jgi:hypothetical protein